MRENQVIVLTTNLLTFNLGWLLTTGRLASWALFSNMARRLRAVSMDGIHSSSSSFLSLRLYSLLCSTSDSHRSNLARSEAAFLALCEDLACIAAKKQQQQPPRGHAHIYAWSSKCITKDIKGFLTRFNKPVYPVTILKQQNVMFVESGSG